jgi:hypothetical protein
MANTACGNVEIHKTDSHISTRIVELEFISRFIEGTEDHGVSFLQKQILRESLRLRASVPPCRDLRSGMVVGVSLSSARDVFAAGLL